jgi:hypothetical protein
MNQMHENYMWTFRVCTLQKIIHILDMEFPSEYTITSTCELFSDFQLEDYVASFYPLWELRLENEIIGVLGINNEKFGYADNTIAGGYLLNLICQRLNQ